MLQTSNATVAQQSLEACMIICMFFCYYKRSVNDSQASSVSCLDCLSSVDVRCRFNIYTYGATSFQGSLSLLPPCLGTKLLMMPLENLTAKNFQTSKSRFGAFPPSRKLGFLVKDPQI